MLLRRINLARLPSMWVPRVETAVLGAAADEEGSCMCQFQFACKLFYVPFQWTEDYTVCLNVLVNWLTETFVFTCLVSNLLITCVFTIKIIPLIMSQISHIYISICKSVLKYDLKYWRDRKVTQEVFAWVQILRILRSTVSVISTHHYWEKGDRIRKIHTPQWTRETLS